ncbi:hypothetical protein EDB85DRAFT_1997006, partial [Lactarius pseudohatsudake]
TCWKLSYPVGIFIALGVCVTVSVAVLARQLPVARSKGWFSLFFLVWDGSFLRDYECLNCLTEPRAVYMMTLKIRKPTWHTTRPFSTSYI